MNIVRRAEIRYADYLTTCPLLVLDLLWNLDAPYKWCALYYANTHYKIILHITRFITQTSSGTSTPRTSGARRPPF